MRDYKDTLNLPSTGFPMRANLTNKEPETGSKWEDQKLYNLILEKNRNKTFILRRPSLFKREYPYGYGA